MLIKKRGELEKIANKLLDKEILFQNDLEKLIGKRAFKTTHIDLKEVQNNHKKDSNNKSTNNGEEEPSIK